MMTANASDERTPLAAGPVEGRVIQRFLRRKERANPEREIDDMDKKIEDLQDAISDLEGAVKAEIIGKLQSVVDEWDGCTRDCIKELAAEAEGA